MVRGGVWVEVDTRDNWYRPASGAVADIGVEYSHGLGFDHSSYFRMHAGLSAALDLWQRARVLLVSVSADDVEPTGATPVPFTELVVLGGPSSLRGARPGRFRDLSSLLMSAEYRWPLWMWADASLFVDYGGVFGRGFDGFAIDKFQPDVGGGLRVRTSRELFFGLQTAYGFSEGWQLFLAATTVIP
jgi:outer membrane protein assembly factor BamA